MASRKNVHAWMDIGNRLATTNNRIAPLQAFTTCRNLDLINHPKSRCFHHSVDTVYLDHKPPSVLSKLTSALKPSRSPSCSSKPIPSFVPSNRTLEFRIIGQPGPSSASRLRRNLPDKSLSDNLQASTSSSRSAAEKNNSQNKFSPLDPHFSGEPIHVPRETINRLPRISSRREDNWSIKCTQIDQDGKILASRSMSKGEICAQNRLQPRDLRKIDSRISNVVPSILVRDEAIIFNVLNIRALIKANSVIIFDHPSTPSVSIPPAESEESGAPKYAIRSAFLHNLVNNLREHDESTHLISLPGTLMYGNELPYEFRALESMLSSVASSLESELGVLKTLVSSLLDGLDRNIEREKLKQLLLYSRRLSAFNSRALLVQECLDEILENDQDMANAYLSEKILRHAPRQPDDHEEFEQLLESFSKYIEEIIHEGKSILNNIKSTEEIIELILDSNRNTLLALDLKVSIATMGLGSGALIAGLFGMNLRTNMENHPHAFWAVTGISIGTVTCAVAYGLMRLNRLRRVGLSTVGHLTSERNSSLRRSQMRSGGILDWDVPSSSSARTFGLGKWKDSATDRSM